MPNNTTLNQNLVNPYYSEISFIRRLAANGELIVSDHAHQRISQRGISLLSLFDAVENGTLLEIQNLERDLKFVFQDCKNPPCFFVVVAPKQNNKCLVITTYEPDSRWELVSGNWRRK
ncbi:DUF4258 domain-containing protein [Acetobacterium carbinolicum]|uniref:DUF4258 domain-containing protein n=1 Tax=Acetobacterium carbinolicum TaxID=52690 RepID=UPI0039BF0C99